MPPLKQRGLNNRLTNFSYTPSANFTNTVLNLNSEVAFKTNKFYSLPVFGTVAHTDENAIVFINMQCS